jgi:hypothetical protein
MEGNMEAMPLSLPSFPDRQCAVEFVLGGKHWFVKVPPKIQRMVAGLGLDAIFRKFPDEEDEESLISSRFNE